MTTTLTKMNPEVKSLWLEALRSGEYRQGGGRLRRHDTYCCLGVLCDLAVRRGLVSENVLNSRDSEMTFTYGVNRAIGILPGEVMNWAGLDDCSPSVMREDLSEPVPLYKLNDVYGLDFKYIADRIEASL